MTPISIVSLYDWDSVCVYNEDWEEDEARADGKVLPYSYS